MIYDVIIVGSGPAGISASLYLKRADKNILILSKKKSALEKAEIIENYYGLEHPISGRKLVEIGEKQAANLNIPIIEDEVIEIALEEYFQVITVNSEYQAKKVILATGTSRTIPNIKGIKEFEGKGVSYCAVCDAFFYKGKDVAVLGNGNYAIAEAKHLRPVANSVTILTNGEQIVENRDGESFEIENEPIREFRGDKIIEEVEFKNDTIKKINGVFVAVGTASGNDLARKLGVNIQNGNILVDEDMQTSVKGLYACGDCTGGLLQINKAVYEGAKAGMHIINEFNKI